MSLINKMLRDLDKRHAPQGGTAAPAGGLSRHMHPVTERALASDFFWRTMAMMMLFAVSWVAWLVWQLMPRPIVTELAYQSSRGKISAPAPQAVAPGPAVWFRCSVSALAVPSIPPLGEPGTGVRMLAREPGPGGGPGPVGFKPVTPRRLRHATSTLPAHCRAKPRRRSAFSGVQVRLGVGGVSYAVPQLPRDRVVPPPSTPLHDGMTVRPDGRQIVPVQGEAGQMMRAAS